MKNNDIKSFTKLILVVNVIILFVCSAVLLFLQKYSWLFGYFLGSVTSYITFLLHTNYVTSFGLDNRSSTKKSIASALLRLLLSAVSLFVALYVSFIDLIATFIGLVVLKFTLFVVSFILWIKKEGIK